MLSRSALFNLARVFFSNSSMILDSTGRYLCPPPARIFWRTLCIDDARRGFSVNISAPLCCKQYSQHGEAARSEWAIDCSISKARARRIVLIVTLYRIVVCYQPELFLTYRWCPGYIWHRWILTIIWPLRVHPSGRHRKVNVQPKCSNVDNALNSLPQFTFSVSRF